MVGVDGRDAKRVAAATPRKIFARALALCSGWVYVAAMDATFTFTRERTAVAAWGDRPGMPIVALQSNIVHAG